MIDVLLVCSRAKSHEKIVNQIANYLDQYEISYFIQKITDEPIRDFNFRLGIFVITFDRYSICEIVKFFPHVKRKVLYVTVEGIPIIDKLAHEVLNDVDIIIANSHYTREKVELLGYKVENVIHHEALIVKPNIDKLNELKEIVKDKKVILWIGMNQKRKGLNQLAKITRKVVEIRDDVIFIVVTGLGEVNLNSLGFASNTILKIEIGNLSEDILSAYYNIADIVISTSYCEGFGMTINEALAYGKKVLTPHYPPFTEYVFNTAKIDKVYYVNYMNYMLFEWHVLNINDFVKKLLNTIDKNITTGKPYINTYDKFIPIIEEFLY